ncbi:hypothetical protein BpHYR1_034121 [Brachionus plicatilis]|uniref:Uncharacterized protein n=1 Tax=Brachionus plicatilis TaxID=10195 RepID=A0A3M7RC79_BRAPC|nr:hypothetical protein BpHYR1_034121 [Brachionus plicatilis]
MALNFRFFVSFEYESQRMILIVEASEESEIFLKKIFNWKEKIKQKKHTMSNYLQVDKMNDVSKMTRLINQKI